MACYCFLRNIVDLYSTGDQTAYVRRFGVPFKGPLYPFGASVKYFPIAQKDKELTHELGPKTLPGIFMGYKQEAGGGWDGNLPVCDTDELQQAACYNDIYVKTFKAAEVLDDFIDGKPWFPVAAETVQQPSSASRLRGARLDRRKLNKKE